MMSVWGLGHKASGVRALRVIRGLASGLPQTPAHVTGVRRERCGRLPRPAGPRLPRT